MVQWYRQRYHINIVELLIQACKLKKKYVKNLTDVKTVCDVKYFEDNF